MFERLPPLRALQVFEAVGRHGSVSVAAVELNISPGAISQHIRRLEADAGVSLFELNGRRLALTTWGRLYLEKVQAGFFMLRSANEVLQRARLNSGIVISAPPSLVLRWLRPILTDWQQATGGVNLHVIGEDAEPDFEDKQVDFRISYGAARNRYGHFSDLFTDHVIPACSPKLFATRKSWSAADILSGPKIGTEWDNPHQSPPTWGNWANFVGLSAPEAPCALSFSLSSAAVDAAIDDGGIVLGQYSMIARDLSAGRLVALSDKWLALAEPYALAWNPSALDRPLGREFRQFMLQKGKAVRALFLRLETD
jgi:LysR family glycine cleavage system transcriptional activator